MGKVTSEDIEKWASKRKVKPLLKAIDKKDTWVSTKAIEALAKIGDPSTVEPLLRHILDGIYVGLPANIIISIGDFSSPKTIPLYIEMLSRNTLQIDNAAATVLNKMGAITVEPLIAALKSTNLSTRKWAANLLGSRRDPRAVEPLIAALDDDDGNMRRSTAKALALIGDRRAIEPLKAELAKKRQHDYAESVVREAIEQLEKGETVPDTSQGETVKVTIKISAAMHGSTEYIGEYNAELPLDAQGPQLLNSIAKSIIWKDQVRFYTGYQLVCRNGTLRSSGSGSIQKPITLRDAGVQAGDTVELLDWGGSFM